MISVGHVWGYSHWASYLVNNDPSGLDDKEQKEADRFIKEMEKEYGASAYICDAGEDGYKDFGWPEYGGLKGEIVPYTVHFKKEESIYADYHFKRKKA